MLINSWSRTAPEEHERHFGQIRVIRWPFAREAGFGPFARDDGDLKCDEEVN